MEYRCYMVGDAVTEPGAVLRRLLYQPFPEVEARTLQQQSLLFTRSEEAKGTNAYPMAVSLPNLLEARTASLTLPNPSMPSVDITVQFAAVTDTREFERIMVSHYKAPTTTTRGFTRGLRRSFSSPVSSMQDLLSSEMSSIPSGTHGLALHALPQAIVLTFNPFSICSFSKLRVEWVHSLRVLRQQRQQLIDAATQQHQQQSNSELPALKRATSVAFPGTSVPATPTASGYAAESVEGFPVVLLVATRMELMRDTMEATPSIHVPSSLEVTEVAQALQAQAYVEVGTNWDESVDVLRAAVARACMGELANAPVVTYNSVYAARQASIARAIEAVHMDPYEEEEEMEEGSGIAGGGGGPMASTSNAAADALDRSLEGTGEVLLLSKASSPMDVPPLSQHQKKAEASKGDEHTAKAPANADEAPKAGTTAAHTAAARAAPSTAPSGSLAEEQERHAEESVAESSQRGAAAEDEDRGMASGISNAHEPSSPEAPMRGRQLRKHLVTALAPLIVPGEEVHTKQTSQAKLADSSTPPAPPVPSSEHTSLRTSTAAAERHQGREAPLSSPFTPGTNAQSSAERSTWTRRRHPRTHRVFYVNRASGKAQYECPEMYDGPPVAAAASDAKESRKGQRSADARETSTGTLAATTEKKEEGEHSRCDLADTTASYGGDIVRSVNNSNLGTSVESHEDDDHMTLQDATSEMNNSESGPPQQQRNEDKTPVMEESGGVQSAREDLGSRRQLQQLQLRRTQVERLEHQVHQLRLQSTRLRAQSEANAELKHKVALLRSELEDKEQAFSARVAEQNQQLAKEVLNTTMAVEELVGLGMPSFAKDATSKSESNSSGTERRCTQAPGGDDGSAKPGLAKDIQQLDADIQDCMQSLHLALARRDAAAEALGTLLRRRQRVAEHKREVDQETADLLRRGVKLEEDLLPLQEELDSAQAEARQLRERVRSMEEKQRKAERQRQCELEAYVAERRRMEERVRELERLRQERAAAQETYQETLRSLRLPSRLRCSEAEEECTRVRLGVEKATGRCCEALLLSAQALYSATAATRDLAAATGRIAAKRAEQQQRVAHAYEVAVRRRAEAVQMRYASAHSRENATARHGLHTAEEHNFGEGHHTPMELLEVAVDASGEACERWKEFDAGVTAPLLDRAQSVEAELMLLLRHAADAPRRAQGLGVEAHQRGLTSALCQWWLRAKIASIRSAAEERCRAPLQQCLRHLTAMEEAAVVAPHTHIGGLNEASINVNTRDVSVKATHSSRSAPPSLQLSAVTPGHLAEYGAALEKGLWSTCDQLMKRLSHLDDGFVSAYLKMRAPP